MADAHYTEPTIINMVGESKGCNKNTKMVKTTEGFKQENDKIGATEGLRVKLEKLKITDGANLEVNMVEVSKEREAKKENAQQSEKQVRVAYPKSDESLVEFLHRFQKKKSEVMMCPGCSSVFDKKVAENIERVRMASYRRKWRDTRSHFTFYKREVPRMMEQGGLSLQPNRPTTFKPTADAPRAK